MESMRRWLLLIIFVTACANVNAAQFVRLADKKPADMAEVMKEIKTSDVVFVGEVHTAPEHRSLLLDIIRDLHDGGMPLAIALEMFTSADQGALDQWVMGKMSEEAFKEVYARNWSYSWDMYRELFIFARDKRISLIALNIPKSVASKVVAQGPSALTADEIPPKMSWILNEQQSSYMKSIGAQVFGGSPPPQLLERISKAQALRNQWMAWNIARYRKNNRRSKTVVLCGVWHAVKNGVPERLLQYEKLNYQVILPELPEFNLQHATVKEADYLLMN